MISLWLLFLSAFISSTLMPGGSELLFAALLREQAATPAVLLLVATTGNTLGGMTSWGIGRLLAWRYPGRTLEQKHHVAVERVRRYGRAALLLSWVPVVGDPLCVAAGWLRVSWWQSLVLIGVGKAARYGAMVLALG